MQRLAPVFLFVLTFVLGGLLEAVPVHAADEEIIDAQADAPKAGRVKAPVPAGDVKVITVQVDRAKAPIRGGPDDEDALWWNDPEIVKALSLTEEQRKKMGEYLKAYRENVPQDRQPEEFHETLVQGDWEAARSEGERLAKSAATLIRMRGTLKIDVLSLLSKEQREMLIDRYPRLIYRPWRRAMRGASPR
jgi:Spy/CpxP family protein refolding chaperone